MKKLAQYKKFVWAGAAFLVTVATGLLQVGNVIPDKYTPWVVGVVTFLGAIGVRQSTNAPLDGGPQGDL